MCELSTDTTHSGKLNPDEYHKLPVDKTRHGVAGFPNPYLDSSTTLRGRIGPTSGVQEHWSVQTRAQ